MEQQEIFSCIPYSWNVAGAEYRQYVPQLIWIASGSIPPYGGERKVLMADKKLCVFKVSPSGIQKPLYFGSEEDCRKFCENRDYEFIDEEQVVWYLEIGRREDEEAMLAVSR